MSKGLGILLKQKYDSDYAKEQEFKKQKQLSELKMRDIIDQQKKNKKKSVISLRDIGD